MTLCLEGKLTVGGATRKLILQSWKTQLHLLDNTRVYCSLTLSMSGGERKRPPTHPSASTTTAHTHPHTQKHTHTSTFKKSREKDTNYALVLAITPQLSNLDPLCHKYLQESVLYAPAYITVLVFFQVSCTVWSIWTCCHVAKKKGCIWVILHTLHTNTHTHSISYCPRPPTLIQNIPEALVDH